MSQERLGDHLGLTFQQVQKYEKGTNRIGASRLYEISRVLSVPVSFFYEELKQENELQSGFAENDQSDFDTALMTSGDSIQLSRAFFRIKDSAVRRRIIDLVRTVADSQDND